MTDSTNDRAPAAATTAPEEAASTQVAPRNAVGANATPGNAVGANVADAVTGADAGLADADAERTSVAETVSVENVRVRRTPRYARFALVGALVCIAAAFILTYSFPQGAGYDRNTVFGFMVIVAVTVGVALGCIAALIAERVTSRRAHTVAADRIDVSSTPAIGAGEDGVDGAPAGDGDSGAGPTGTVTRH